MFDIFNDISPDTVQKMMEKEKETAPVTYTLYISDEKVINFLDSQKNVSAYLRMLIITDLRKKGKVK